MTDGNGNSSTATGQVNVTFGTTGSPPAAPTLIAPGSGSAPGPSVNNTTPTLSWNSDAGGGQYDLYISQAPYGTAALIYQNRSISGGATSFTVPAGVLAAGGQYAWSMQASNSSGVSAYSNILYFMVAGGAPTVSGVSPNPVPGSGSAQQITITGSNFVNGATLTYHDPQDSPYTGRSATFVNSGQVTDPAFNNNNDPGIWTVTVVNPGGSSSSAFKFTVSTASGGTVDPYRPYNGGIPGQPTATDVVNAALNYVGAEWGASHCTGLVWAVSDAIGADYYETANQVANDAGETTSQVRITVPDPGNPPTVPATPSGFPGYVVPSDAGAYGPWTTIVSTTSNGDQGWTADVQIGDLVRIPASALAENVAHSFIVVGGNQQSGWQVLMILLQPVVEIR